MHARPLDYRSATSLLALGLLAALPGCDEDSTVVPDPEVVRIPVGWVAIRVQVDGPTEDWGGVSFSVEEVGGGASTGRYLTLLGGLHPTEYIAELPVADYGFRTHDVDPFCSLSGPAGVSISERDLVAANFTLHCGPLTEEPAGGLLAASFRSTFVLAEPDGTMMRFFLPETSQFGCSINVGPDAAARGSSGASEVQSLCSYTSLDWCADGSRMALRAGSALSPGIYAASGSGEDLTKLHDGSLPLDVRSGVSTDRSCSRVAFAMFASDQSGRVGVYSIPIQGGTPVLIADSAAEPAWSTSDDRIAFVREGQVVVMDDTGSSIVIGQGRCPDWAPDGTRVAFAHGGHVQVANADGSGEPETVSTIQASTVWCPRWSTDGSWIAYQADTSTRASAISGDVFLLRLVDGLSYRLTYWRDPPLGAVAWVPPDAPVRGDGSSN